MADIPLDTRLSGSWPKALRMEMAKATGRLGGQGYCLACADAVFLTMLAARLEKKFDGDGYRGNRQGEAGLPRHDCRKKPYYAHPSDEESEDW